MFHFGTNHHANGGTASCRSAVFFGSEEEGRGRERDFERREEDFERREEEGEEGNGTLRRRNKDSEKDGNGNRGGWEMTWRGRKRTEEELEDEGNKDFERAKQGL